MANSNVNIGSRLFAYIAHSADVSQKIAQQYKSSMLFIGDEQQIYVPEMGAYVGIGMTAYNNTMNFVLDVRDKLTDLEKALKSSMVSKIYPQWNPGDSIDRGGNPLTYLTQEITIKGIGDYDPSTGFSYTTYTVVDARNVSHTNTVTYTENNRYATSGITVTYYSTPSTTTAGGEIIAGKNYLVIDDKLTWSYIASAYTYSMNFAKKYTASEVERLYHNLLGDGDVNDAYLPADFHEAMINEIQNPDGEGAPTHIAYHVLNNDKPYWFKKVVNVTLPADTTPEAYVKGHSEDVDGFEKAPDGTITFWKWTQYGTTGNGLVDATAMSALTYYPEQAFVYDGTNAPTYIYVPQLYEYSSEYNYTYNINIADGIQTLKEVAYLLDVLTDGLGELTYISHAEYLDYGVSTGDHYDANTVYYLVNGTAYSTSNYAYYFKQNPENLGLQMAYSLASLKIDTNDLHHHTDFLEDGATTLRSVVAQGSKFANVTVAGQNKVTVTDHNMQVAGTLGNEFDNGVTTLYAAKNSGQNVPNTGEIHNWSGNSYTLGDADIRLKLDLTQTYMTVEQDATNYENIYDADAHVVQIGDDKVVLQAADMAQIDPTTGTYYTLSDNYTTYTYIANPETNVHNQRGLQYYWQPSTNAISEKYINTKFKKVDAVYIANAAANTKFYISKTDAQSFEPALGNVAGQYSELSQSQAAQAKAAGKDVYIIKAEAEAGVIRPVIDNHDAIATASWVASYLTAAISGLGDQFDDILQEAKDYTDSKIDALDSESLYSDFGANVWDAWCAANISGQYVDSTGEAQTGAGSIIFNSQDYETQKASHYSYYKSTNNTDTAPSNYAKRAVDLYGENSDPVSNYNKQYSEYVYSTVEEDGIVKTQTRELPTDRISSRTEVWGTQSSTIYQRSFVELTNATVGTDNIVSDSDITTSDAANDNLFAFVNTKTYDNNIYVQTNDEFEYVPVAATDYAAKSWSTDAANLYYLDNKTGKFVVLTSASGNTQSATYVDWMPAEQSQFSFNQIDGIHAPRFVQLYTRTPKYAEVDLETIVWNATYTGFTSLKAEGVQYTAEGNSTITTYYIPGENNGSGNTDPRNNAATANKQYISTHYKHYSATSTTHGSTPGHGENEFEVVTYITNIEDATKNNTGLADAYDVKTFVENFFNWVDLSATVTADQIATNVAWYDKITYYAWSQDPCDIYYNNGTQFVKVNADAVLSTPGGAAASGQRYANETGETEINGVAIVGPEIWGDPDPGAELQSTYTGWVMNGSTRQTYYILKGEPKTNNVNLTLTKYTNKIVTWTERV